MRALRLVVGSDDAIDFTSPSHPLRLQPQRPGQLCSQLRLAVADQTVKRIEAGAQAAGIPKSLFATLAIDSARHVTATSEMLGIAPLELATTLDAAAAENQAAQLLATGSLGKFRQYAAALRRGEDPDDPATQQGGPLVAIVSEETIAGWTISAINSGMALADWAGVQLTQASLTPHLWEAAAAHVAQSLQAWILDQAASSSRSATTSAHPFLPAARNSRTN
jgi:hypothetical protein